MISSTENTQIVQQLLEAVIKKDLITVKALCTPNNVNSTLGKRGFTALHFAALNYENLDIAMHLMNTLGCDVNKPCFSGEPAIFLAALKGHEDLVKLFLLKGAKVDSVLLAKYSKSLSTNYPKILEALADPEAALQQSSYTWQQPAASSNSIRQRNPHTYGTEMTIVNK